jgi:malate dehydrogenase (oxaloacetate-decarboxylating)
LISWTDGKALIATGSPFGPAKYGGKTIDIAQCNNVYIFPAVGLGLVASQARRVTDKMLLAAANALGEQSPAMKDPTASLLPGVQNLREIAREIAFAVGITAQEEGLAPKVDEAEFRRLVTESQWAPEYVEYEA